MNHFLPPRECTLEQQQAMASALKHQPALPEGPTATGTSLFAASAFAQDEEWCVVRRIGCGDEAALAMLYRRYYNRLRRFVFRITSDEGGTDDVVNEVMLVVWHKAADVTPRARVSTWVLGIAYKKALKARERDARHGRHLDGLLDHVQPLSQTHENAPPHPVPFVPSVPSVLFRRSHHRR